MTSTAFDDSKGGPATVGSAAVGDSQHASSSDSGIGRRNLDDEGGAPPPNGRRPADVALMQQRMKSWQPLLDPKWVISAYLLIGCIFIPTGIVIRNKSNNIIELKSIYESYLREGPSADVTGCEIDNSPNKMYLATPKQSCLIKVQVPFDKGDMDPPILVHYELSNFYQNHRKYTTSLDQNQLFGSLKQDSVSAEACDPLNKIGGITINPCGMIANTLFNDVIKLKSVVGPDGEEIENTPMVEKGIAWQSDLRWKFRQPEGFKSKACNSCQECDCSELNEIGERVWSCQVPYEDESGNCFLFYYPNDDTTQYLFETYPMVVSPLDGVTNEHFVVWMRTAALPNFRKLYGYIERTIPAGSVLTFSIQSNWAVKRNEGAKALVVSNTYTFGGKNHWLGTLFVAVGSIAAILGSFFLAKDLLAPRRLGDRMYLKYKGD